MSFSFDEFDGLSEYPIEKIEDVQHCYFFMTIRTHKARCKENLQSIYGTVLVSSCNKMLPVMCVVARRKAAAKLSMRTCLLPDKCLSSAIHACRAGELRTARLHIDSTCTDCSE